MVSTSTTSVTGPAAEPDVVALDQGLWHAFTAARGERAFLTGWLSLLVSRVPQAALGVVLQADLVQGAFLPVAVVPDPRRDLSALREIAERTLGSGRPASAMDDEGTVRLAHPLRAGADAPVEVVVVLELRAASARAVQAALREMHWASGWLAARVWERRAADGAARLARAGVALDVLAVASEHRRPEAAAMAIVNELQTVLACDQVSMGMLKGARSLPRVRLLALSYSAWFKRRSALAESLEAAMEECFDQGAPVSVPPLPAIARAIAVAHGDHLRRSATQHMLSVPMHDDHHPVGVLSFERRQADRPFTDEDRLIAESVAALVGPVMELKRRSRRWLGGRLVDGTMHVLGILLGRRRLSWKLLALVLAGLLVAGATVRGPFRVQAEAVLRGEVQRAAVAPFAGFVAAGPLRAGDVVRAGDLIAQLDDTDLRLEDLRWRSEIDRLASQQRAALAQYDREQVALLEAQIAQARAQLRLTEAQLGRTRIVAPIDGMIVAGDLTQRLGAPVQLGEVLFEVAPLDAFRVDIFLDERDLRHVAPGMRGDLSLTGRPADPLGFDLTRITPVAEVRDGINAFRAEGRLDAAAVVAAGLRPGMEGVARVEAGEALVVWVWSRRLVDWLRQTAWTWQP